MGKRAMRITTYTRSLGLLLKDRLRKWLRPAIAKELEEQAQKRKTFFLQFIKPGDLVFDVGANLGNRVEAFLLAGAKVVAFEPQSTCYQFLKLKFGSRIKVQNKALGETTMRGSITLNKDSSTIATMSDQWKQEVGKGRFSNYRWGKTEVVAIDTLENQLKTFGLPHFVKIDVEGFEEQVLRGLSTPVPVLSFEYTSPEMTQAALNCIQLLNDLSPLYEFNFAVGENTWFENEQWLTFQAMQSLLMNNIGALKGFGDIYARLKK